MNLYLGIAIILFLLLFFTNKEGFYSDTNVSSAIDDLKSFNKKLDTLKTTVDGFNKSDLTAMDAVSSIAKVVNTKDSALYNSGVVSHVQAIKAELDTYQSNVMMLNEALISLPNSFIVKQIDHRDKTQVSLSLSVAIQNLTQTANKISSQLNKIPDS